MSWLYPYISITTPFNNNAVPIQKTISGVEDCERMTVLQPDIPPDSDPQSFQTESYCTFFFETKPVHQIEPNIQFTYMSQYYLRQDNVGRVIILVSRYRTCRSKIITFCLITICVRKVITICVDFFITFCANVITFCGDSYYILR